MKKTLSNLQNAPKPLVCLTAYTAPMTKIFDAHCDILLVGDSVSMVLYGDKNTRGATLDMMIRHGKAVAKTAQKAFVVVDMPFGSYEVDPAQALSNAQKIMDDTGCDGIKLEGGELMAATVSLLVQNSIPVMGHVGLTPQMAITAADFKVQGKNEASAQQIIKDAIALEQAGAFSLVIEAVPEPLARQITDTVTIPTIGIGASAACDGQILVSDDMLGLGSGHIPKFVKQYDNLSQQIAVAVTNYATDVRSRHFPASEHVYSGINSDKMGDDKKKAS